MIVDAALVAALMQDNALRQCVADVGESPGVYIAKTWEFRRLTLHSGERMTVAIAKSGCLVSQNGAIRVYREVGDEYRLVLADNALPESVEARSDGTISFAAHDTIDTIVEPVFVWNGTSYAFAPERSHIFDVSVDLGRPYQLAVRFEPGTFSTVLRGTYAENFGQTYVFVARAGQTATIELLEPHEHVPGIALTYGHRDVGNSSGKRWSAVLPYSGTYALDVFGYDLPAHDTLVPYAVRLTIR